MGAEMVRGVASKSSSFRSAACTTTATVLAQVIVKEGSKSGRSAAGMNPMDLKRGIDLAVEHVVSELQKNSKKVTSNEEIAQVGTIGQRRCPHRQGPRRRDEAGRQRRRHHG